MKTYQHCLQPVEGQESWPILDMPRPLPPAFVKMPGRSKTQRTREAQEKPKGTKISRVGIKMTCRICHSTKHNIRKCPLNKEAGNKNAYIKRDANRKRKERENATSTASASVTTSAPPKKQRARRTRQAPSVNQQGTSTSGTTRQAPSRTSNRQTSWRNSRVAHLMFGDNI